MAPNTQLRNICLIHVFFGKKTSWFDLFVRSCSYNNSIDFILFTDISDICYSYSNVRVIDFSLAEFKNLVFKNTGITPLFSDPYKVCDFKPMFGKLFEDYLRKYDYWGYIDNDLLLGNVQSYLMEKVKVGHIVISTYKDFMSGPLAIFRNQFLTNNLFLLIKEYRKVCALPHCQGIDENIQRKSLKGYKLEKWLWLILFLLTPKNIKRLLVNYQQVRYELEWYFKRKLTNDKHPIDLTEAIWKLESLGKKICFAEILKSDIGFERIGEKRWNIEWKEGALTNKNTEEEILGFHFIKSKNNLSIHELNPDSKKVDLYGNDNAIKIVG